MTNEEKNYENVKEFVEKNYWKVRECDEYKAEYKDCVSFASRFHQYFVHGESIDCSMWKEDLENCKRGAEDLNAYASIIKNEDKRMKDRIDRHVANNVWKPRKNPPENWNSELPNFLKDRQKFSFSYSEEENQSFLSCSIF